MTLNRYWVIVLALAAGLGVWQSRPLLTLAGLFGLLLTGAGWLWMRHCMTGLEYERKLGATHAAWGDEVTLTLRMANRKLLPLTWLQAEDRVPASLPIARARPSQGPSGQRLAYLRNLLPLLPYEQVVRRYLIPCRRRGLFQFGPARLESGDLLGYASRSVDYPATDRLIVYPKLFDLDLPTPLSKRIVGMQAVNRLMLTDPSRTVGVRGYQPGDPLRHVEWRSTARSGDLLVRLFEPTTELALAIFLNFRVARFAWQNDDLPELEFTISLAASLAAWALRHQYPAGLFGNGSPEVRGAVRVPVSGDPDQLQRILETLALATPTSQTGIAEVLLDEAAGLPFEASAVLITASFDQRLLVAIEELRRRRPVTIWHVRTGWAAGLNLPGVNTVSIDYDDLWEERDHLHLAA